MVLASLCVRFAHAEFVTRWLRASRLKPISKRLKTIPTTGLAVAMGSLAMAPGQAWGGQVSGSGAIKAGVTATPLHDYSTFDASNGVRPYKEFQTSGKGTTTGNGHGIKMVDDPAGVRDSAGTVRKVIRFRADKNKGSGGVVRSQLATPYIVFPGQHRWIYYEIFVPSSFPLITGRGAFFSTGSVYTGGGSGTGPLTQMVDGGAQGALKDGVNDHAWAGHGSYSANLTEGKWYKVARRHLFKTDSTGRTEIWAAPLGEPLVKKIDQSHRTLVGGNNYKASTGSFLKIGNYHSDNVNTDYPTYTDVFYANHKVFDGAASVSDIDPDD